MAKQIYPVTGMKPPSATPLHVVESYFDVELDRSALKRFDDVPYERWVDFAKHYLKFMDERFAEEFLDPDQDDRLPLRLYFEPRMAHEWETAVGQLYAPTPLLGVSPDPGRDGGITRDDVSRMLDPFKKHLLLANSVYVRDSFYYCFDMVADSVDRERWPDDPNTVRLVEESVRRLKRWLPILIELRKLIESRAIVFMPYYLTPSFPFSGDSPALQPVLEQVRVRPAAEREQPATGQANPWVNSTEVLGAWLNGRLLGLDPVFPNRAMFDLAADLYFDTDEGAGELTTDLMSIDILPFGRGRDLGLDDLVSLRKNEGVFEEVRGAVVACREFLEDNLRPESTQQDMSAVCRGLLRERLDEQERRSVLRIVEDHPAAGIVVSVAVGAALIPVAPAISVAAGALLTPQLALWARRKLDRKGRAIGRLQSLL